MCEYPWALVRRSRESGNPWTSARAVASIRRTRRGWESGNRVVAAQSPHTGELVRSSERYPSRRRATAPRTRMLSRMSTSNRTVSVGPTPEAMLATTPSRQGRRMR